MSHSLSKTVTTAETLNSKFHNRAAQTRVWHHGSYTHLLFSLWLWATWSIVGSHYIWRHWKSSADSHLWFPVFQVMSRPWMDDLQSRTQIAHSFAVNGLTTFSTAGMEQHYFFYFLFYFRTNLEKSVGTLSQWSQSFSWTETRNNRDQLKEQVFWSTAPDYHHWHDILLIISCYIISYHKPHEDVHTWCSCPFLPYKFIYVGTQRNYKQCC